VQTKLLLLIGFLVDPFRASTEGTDLCGSEFHTKVYRKIPGSNLNINFIRYIGDIPEYNVRIALTSCSQMITGRLESTDCSVVIIESETDQEGPRLFTRSWLSCLLGIN